MVPGKASPTASSRSQNSSTTASRVSRSIRSIDAMSCASRACASTGSEDSFRSAPSTSISRTITAAFWREVSAAATPTGTATPAATPAATPGPNPAAIVFIIIDPRPIPCPGDHGRAGLRTG